MTLTINDSSMTSDRTAHTARHAPDRDGWEGSCLPGQTLNRNSAITAMILADTAAEPDLHEGHRLWPLIQGWAAELGLTAPDAIAKTSRPPSDLNRQPEQVSRHPPTARQLTDQRHTASRPAARLAASPAAACLLPRETRRDRCM